MRSLPAADANLGARIDTSALREPLSRRQVRAFTASRHDLFGWNADRLLETASAVMTVVVATVVLLAVTPIGLFFLLVLVLGPTEPDLAARPEIVVAMLLAPVGVIGTALLVRLVVDVVRGSVGPLLRPRRLLRLLRFAADNGFAHIPREPEPRQPGTLFAEGARRLAYDVQVTPDADLEIGNYQWAAGWLTQRAVRRMGYLRVQLPQRMPHVVLQSRRRFGRRTLPWRIHRIQRLRLEGDFDRHFTLLVPAGYERDVLRLFTPDLMALLIDRFHALDVEVVEDQLYIYSNRPFDMLAPVTYQRALAVARTIAAPTVHLASRWVDERDGGLGGVLPRLRLSATIGTVLAAAYCLALVVRAIVVQF